MQLFENATIITMDPLRRIITDGAIAVSDSTILAVGKTNEVRKIIGSDVQQIDLEGMIVIPGLINTHIHQAQSLLRCCADDMGLIDWLFKTVWTLQGNFTPEDGRVSSELSILEMLKSGTTTFLEVMIAGRYGFNGIAEVVEYSGIRGALAKIIMELPTYAGTGSPMYGGMIEDTGASFAEALEMHNKWHGKANGRIMVWFGPRPPGGCTKNLYQEMMSEANERNMRVTVHLAEVEEDVSYIKQKYGMSPVEFIDSIGMIGPKVLLANTTIISRDEMKRLTETGTSVCHNPLCNVRMGEGVAPIPAMLESGVNISLGTEGGSGNNVNDMIRTMRWASYLHKINGMPVVTPAESVLEMATINGAKALGLENEIGSIEVNKKADFVVLDNNKPHLTPSPNPVSTIVCCMNGGDVNRVVIDGKTIVHEGRVLTMDEGRIMAESRERAKNLYERAQIKVVPRWPIL
jgi:cytosine/adenosine deaminase-related metal-dependent hydrolase